MNLVPILAKRFLTSKSSDGFLSLISWVSIVGVALGVLALVVVTSVINGFEGDLARVITGMNGDILFYSKAEPVSDFTKVENKLREVVPETQDITHSYMIELMVSGPTGVAGGILEGFDVSTLGKVTEIPQRVSEGRLPEVDGEIALGNSLAERIGATVGSDIRIIIPFGGTPQGAPSDSPENTAPKTVKGHVVGFVHMGMNDYDSRFIFVTLPWVQKFLNQPGRVTSFNLRLTPGADSRLGAEHLTDSFGYPFRAKDWAQLNKNLFYAIRLEKVVIAIILTVIVVVAAFNVVSTLMMMIHDKTKEIAILKAMGFRRAQSFQLFCLIGLGMGMVGTFFGVGVGLLINLLLAKTHWIQLPADIYYIGYLPVVTRWSDVGWIAVSATFISFLATLYPAIQISLKSPLEGLRYE